MPWINLLKVIHIIAAFAWVGTLFSLLLWPKIYRNGVDPDLLRCAYRRVDLPAMLITILTGLLLLSINPQYLSAGWFHAKLTGVFLLTSLDLFAGWGIKRNLKIWGKAWVLCLLFLFITLSGGYFIRNKQKEWQLQYQKAGNSLGKNEQKALSLVLSLRNYHLK